MPDDGAPPDLEVVLSWSGHRLDDRAGSAVGRVEGAYVRQSGRAPDWLLAQMGRFGHHCLIPARHAVAAAGHVWVPYTREQIRRAPRIEPGVTLSAERARELLAHYGAHGDAAPARPA